MEVLRLLDVLKTFCSRHAALLSVAAVASSFLYWISSGDGSGGKPSSVRRPAPHSNLSSDNHSFVASSSNVGDTGVSGLENVGRNWCYSNGLLQAMASCPVFCSWIEYLLRASPPPVAAGDCSRFSQSQHNCVESSSWLCYGAQSDKMPLISELNTVIGGVNNANYGTGSLKGIYEALEGHGWQISEGEHDCHEMLSVLCSTIQSELESVERVMGYTQKELKQHEKILSRNPGLTGRLDPASVLNVAWLPPAWQEPSPHLSGARSGSSSSTDSKKSLLNPEKKANKGHLEDVLTRQMVTSVRLQSKHMPFGGFFANQLQCLACGNKHAAHWDRFECISLQLPVDAPSSDVSLLSLLERYTSPDLVEDVTCEHCSKLRGAPTKRSFSKRITIGKLPELLVLHINRSVWTDSDNAAYKRSDRVRYPTSLNMAAFTYTHAVNNTVAPSSAGMGSVRGLSRLVEARFSARSSAAQLPLTRKTASVASAGGVQTCANEADSSASPQENSSSKATSFDSSTASSVARTADGPSKSSKARFSGVSNLGFMKRSSDIEAGAASQGKTKEFKCPRIVTPPRWFHSDLSDQLDSSINSKQSVFVSTYQPPLVQPSDADNMSSDHTREESCPAETPPKAAGNFNTIFTNDTKEGEECIDHTSQKEHLYNGVAASEQVSDENKTENNTPNDQSTTGTKERRKETVSKTFPQDSEEAASSNVTNFCTNKCSGSEANGNISNPLHVKHDSNSAEKTEDQSTSLNLYGKVQSCNLITAAHQGKSSSSSGLAMAANGPNQSQAAITAPDEGLPESEGIVINDLPSKSTDSETPVRQPLEAPAAKSTSEASQKDEKPTSSSSRSSDDTEHFALYQLRAVIVHSGSASSGHFTTYRRGPRGSPSWYFTSDETVRRCDMTASIGVEPYMLFYERGQSITPPASTAARLKSSLAALSSIPFSKSKKTSSVAASSWPVSSDDTPAFAVPPSLAAANDAAYFSQSSMFA